MENLGINLGNLLIYIISFLIMALVLWVWAFKPMGSMMDKRKKTIAQGLEDARIAAEARANAEKESAKILADAQAKASEIVREASDRADLAAKDIKVKAEADAAKVAEAAVAEAKGEKERVLREVRGQVSALAISATQKLLGVNLDDQRQHALLNDFFSGVEQGKLALVEGKTITGNDASVTSALPLTDAEKSTIQRDLVGKLSPDATISYAVDPSILGGLVIRVGDQIIDGSVAGKLQNLKQAIS
ncbi:MAG TPA: F0F1 ATP synthase subunit B [Bellilinea sp.]|nr:F0F1 ATP synthase subunit B [Bellilinea sp.]